MIRITLEKSPRTGWDGQEFPAITTIREFESDADACSWLVSDSYFEEPCTRKMTWERIP